MILRAFTSFFELIKELAAAYGRPGVQIARNALGKYIIGFACLLHLGWAALLLVDSRAANCTALSVMFKLLHGDRSLVIFSLLLVSILACSFLDLRLRKHFNITLLSLLLVPQQLVLGFSAGAGIYATFIQKYADGVHRSWAHIAADQFPIVLMAVLYTVALLESRHAPLPDQMTITIPGPKGEKGDKGDRGDKGDKGDSR